MIDDQARALAIVAALLSGASGSAGFVGGRASVSVPPAEVRYVQLPVPIVVPALPVEASPVEPVPTPPDAEPAPPATAIEPPEAKPLPAPRPKVEAKPKPKPKPESPVQKPRPVRSPTASECAQLRFGLATIGRDGVNRQANARGYTNAQVSWALSACRL